MNVPNSMNRVFSRTLMFIFVFTFSSNAFAQTSAFTYQGRLNDSSMAANGSYNMQFALFDSETGGTHFGTEQNALVTVANGVFSVKLDFGAAAFYTNESRFLEIRVKKTSDADFVTLAPRQEITSAPFAIRARDAATADSLSANCVGCVSSSQISSVESDKITGTVSNAANSSQLGGVSASNFVQTNDSRLTDARTPTAGSDFYIQNQTAAQQNANFRINGTGIANILTAQTQFNLENDRILSTPNTGTTFVGRGAGTNNTGTYNSFFGNLAGASNTSGGSNAFFGDLAGWNTTTGNRNSVFGSSAFRGNVTGFENAVFGHEAGLNGAGSSNALFGKHAGVDSTGDNNSFFGRSAGDRNTTGSNNSAFGRSARMSTGNLNFATAIGSEAVVSSSDTIVIGKTAGSYNGNSRPADTVQIAGILSVGGNINTSGNLSVNGTISSGCRSGFTAIAGGRLCVSAMQLPASFHTAVQTCTSLSARVGNSADVMLTFSNAGFNYFEGFATGWLADHMGDDIWGTWNVPAPNPNFDGPALNAGNPLPFRCVY
jgi:hypothetical protein